MAPTEGRVAKPEQGWDCRRGTPSEQEQKQRYIIHHGVNK